GGTPGPTVKVRMGGRARTAVVARAAGVSRVCGSSSPTPGRALERKEYPVARPDGGAAVAPDADLARVGAAMRRAVALSRRGLGRVSPTPVVGCVLLDRFGAPAGEGWHRSAGGPHAEIAALQDAARGRGPAVGTG